MQASGNQVKLAAERYGIQKIETRIYGSILNPDFQCAVLSIERKENSRAESLYGSGYFTLDVTVEQKVYLFANRTFSLESITSMVESGFNRGSGGRVRFRSLLQSHPIFVMVRNVEVLDGPITWYPSPYPTDVPSALPTAIPSLSPTEIPSQTPSISPLDSHSAIPSSPPTEDITEAPIIGRTPLPTDFPSNGKDKKPSLTNSATNAKDNQDEVDTITIAAIVGGAIVIMIALCCVFSMWCRSRNSKQREGSSLSPPSCTPTPRMRRNRKHHPSYKGSSEVLQLQNGEVPNMVALDDGSLANTTLGDQTAGGFRRLAPGKKRLVPDSDGVKVIDSFDENSLYTTPLQQPLAAVEKDAMNDATSNYTMSVLSILPPSVAPFEEETIVYPDIDPPDSGDDESSASAVLQSSLLSHNYPSSSHFSSKKQANVPTFDFSGIPFEKNAENGISQDHEKAKLVSEAMDDESGFAAFQNKPHSLSKLNIGENDKPTSTSFLSMEDSNAPSINSSNSALTKKVENMFLLGFRSAPEDNSDDSPLDEEEKREIDCESRDDGQEPRRSPLPLDLLADTQLLEGSDSTSSWSSWRVSQDSEPIVQVNGETTERNAEESKSDRLGIANNEDIFAADGLQYFIPIKHKSKSKSASLEEKDSTFDDTSEELPSTPDDKNMFVSPTSTGLSSVEDGTGILGVLPRRDPATLEAGSVVSSNSGDNPWLFDALEQTLGPKSPTADIESLSGRSDRSGRSQKSSRSYRSATRSARSNRSRRRSRSVPPKAAGRRDYRAKNAAASVGTYAGSSFREKHSTNADTQTTDRTLGHDLKRLEKQLAALQTETDHITASSITLSSIGARTRSTRSSRLTHTGAKFSRKRRVIVEVPAGKLGVILTNRHDGKGTLVSEVKPDSSLKGMLSVGDKLGT